MAFIITNPAHLRIETKAVVFQHVGVASNNNDDDHSNKVNSGGAVVGISEVVKMKCKFCFCDSKSFLI